MNDIMFLIERLEKLVSESWRIPFSKYLIANEEDLHEVIDQMRTAIPKQIRQAERVYQDRDRLVAQAEEEANRIVSLAHEDAAKQADEHEIIRTANQRAQTVLERAQREAETLRAEADDYARGVLTALEDHLISLDDQVAKAQAKVRGYLEATPQAKEAPRSE